MVRAKTTRAHIRQDCDRAINAIDHVLRYYQRIAETFRQHGRENVAKTFEALAAQLIAHQKLLSDFKDAI